MIKFEFFQDGVVTMKELVTIVLLLLTVWMIAGAPFFDIDYSELEIGIIIGGLVTSVLKITIPGK